MLIANPKKALNLKVQVEVKKARKDKMGLKRSGPVSVNAISGEQNLTPCFTMTSEECLTYHQDDKTIVEFQLWDQVFPEISIWDYQKISIWDLAYKNCKKIIIFKMSLSQRGWIDKVGLAKPWY